MYSESYNYNQTINIPATIKFEGTKYKVTEIEDYAFKGMELLTNVSIGKNVKKIGNGAFKNNKKLKKITVLSTKLEEGGVGQECFMNINKKSTFKVPSKMLKK